MKGLYKGFYSLKFIYGNFWGKDENISFSFFLKFRLFWRDYLVIKFLQGYSFFSLLCFGDELLEVFNFGNFGEIFFMYLNL